MNASNPLTSAIGDQRRFLPCDIQTVPGDPKLKKTPQRLNGSGLTPKDWSNPVHWLTASEAIKLAEKYHLTRAISIQWGGPEHDTTGIDLDSCVKDGQVTTPRASQIVGELASYTTTSVSGAGLHVWLIDQTHLIPEKFNEADGLGIYRHSKHFAETFQPFGDVKPVRVITDPAEARAVCRVLGVIPTDEATIEAPVKHQGDPVTRAATSASRYAQAALKGELDELRAAPQKTRNTTLNKAAFALGQLIGAGALDRPTVQTALLNAALLIGLSEAEASKTIGSGLNAGIAKPREIPTSSAPDQGTNVDMNAVPDSSTTAGQPQHGGADQAPGDQPKTQPAGDKKPPKEPPPTDDELADEWRKLHPLTAYGIGEFRRYNAGIWPIVPDPQIECELLEVIKAAKVRRVRPSKGLVVSVHKLASIEAYIDDKRWNADPDILACANGTLHIPTMTLREHGPEDYQTSGMAFNYDPEAAAPFWDVALSEIPEADFLQEFAGYSLTTDTGYELALWLYGPSGSGKSTVIAGLQAMLGDRCGLLGLAQIERSSFALADLPGKTLVVSTEQPANYMQSSHIVNAVISGESVLVDRKYRDPIEIHSQAKIVWAMNDLPRIPDAGDGLFRRVRVIKFAPRDESLRDPAVKEHIMTEGAGILNWALAGLARLQARGKFDIPASVRAATADFQQQNDVPAVFVAECCYTGASFKVGSQTLYEAYRKWCEGNGHKPQSSTSLAREWERLGFDKKRTNQGMEYGGLGLRADTGGNNPYVTWGV